MWNFQGAVMVLGAMMRVPFTTVTSVAWATLNQRDRKAVVPANSLDEVRAVWARIAPHWTPDPWGGNLDVIEHPGRTLLHLDAGTIHILTGPDCDDMAALFYAMLIKIARPQLTILVDQQGKAIHMVCEFWMRDSGRHGVIDNSGCYWLDGQASVESFYGPIFSADYIRAFPRDWIFGDVSRL